MSPVLSLGSKECITNVIYGDDVIPRASERSLVQVMQNVNSLVIEKKREWLSIPDQLRKQVALGAASADDMITEAFGGEEYKDDQEDVKELREFIQVQSRNLSRLLEEVCCCGCGWCGCGDTRVAVQDVGYLYTHNTCLFC